MTIASGKRRDYFNIGILKSVKHTSVIFVALAVLMSVLFLFKTRVILYTSCRNSQLGYKNQKSQEYTVTQYLFAEGL